MGYATRVVVDWSKNAIPACFQRTGCSTGVANTKATTFGCKKAGKRSARTSVAFAAAIFEGEVPTTNILLRSQRPLRNRSESWISNMCCTLPFKSERFPTCPNVRNAVSTAVGYRTKELRKTTGAKGCIGGPRPATPCSLPSARANTKIQAGMLRHCRERSRSRLERR